MVTIEQMVQREVLCCMSSLISTLAAGGNHPHGSRTTSAVDHLMLQAAELAVPVLDYEEDSILEVYEHWAVSQWLAEKLTAQGERVDTDFAGLNIWARTTTGQAISMDGCIQRIYADMMAPHTLDSVAPGA